METRNQDKISRKSNSEGGRTKDGRKAQDRLKPRINKKNSNLRNKRVDLSWEGELFKSQDSLQKKMKAKLLLVGNLLGLDKLSSNLTGLSRKDNSRVDKMGQVKDLIEKSSVQERSKLETKSLESI